MVDRSSLHVQDSTIGQVEAVLEAVAIGASVAGVRCMDVAVAYASARGVEVLKNRLASIAGWQRWRKRILVSIDFGTTEPAALNRLRALPNAEVRVPRGREVLARTNLVPRVPFHSKAWLFYRSEADKPIAIVVGSGNLTVSGLATGGEIAATQIWSSGPGNSEWLAGAKRIMDWFDKTWSTADGVDIILPTYQRVVKRSPIAGAPLEDLSPTAQGYADSADSTGTAPPNLIAQLTSAKVLYVRVDRATRNLGRGKPGNQIDVPLGTSRFFDLPARRTRGVIGTVSLRISGFPAVSRNVRVGSNGMDKIDLPIPGRDGPDTYDDTLLVFERTDRRDTDGNLMFELEVTDEAGLQRLQASATAVVSLQMAGGRKYGLLFGSPKS